MAHLELLVQGASVQGNPGARHAWSIEWLAGNEGMEKKMETTMGFFGVEGIEKKMETTTMGYIGTTVRIHSFIPS